MLSSAWEAQVLLVENEMEHSEVCVLVRARGCGAFAVALLAFVISTAVPAHADVIPSPEPTGEVIDQPAPSDPSPSPEPSEPEESSDPAPTEPVETAVPFVPPPAPVGTAPFESTRPPGTVVETFRPGQATTSGGTGAEVPGNNAPAPRAVEPSTQPTAIATASPSPVTPTASPSSLTPIASPTPVTAREGAAGSGVAVRSISAPKAPTPPLPSLIIGLVVLVGGLVIVRYRGSVWKAAVGAVPRGSHERVERLQGPFRVGVAGAIVALVGVTLNGYAAWQLLSSLAS